jgi:hypothetical protein
MKGWKMPSYKVVHLGVVAIEQIIIGYDGVSMVVFAEDGRYPRAERIDNARRETVGGYWDRVECMFYPDGNGSLFGSDDREVIPRLEERICDENDEAVCPACGQLHCTYPEELRDSPGEFIPHPLGFLREENGEKVWGAVCPHFGEAKEDKAGIVTLIFRVNPKK